MTTVLTIRDVPVDVKAALAQQARERGQSLQAFALAVLKRQADFSRNRQSLVDVEHDLANGGGAGTEAPSAADMLAAARAEQELSEGGSGDAA